MTEPTTALDPRGYRNTIGLFASGVTVVSSEVDGQVHGMTANAVSSVSLEPMLLLVCVGKKAHMAGLLSGAAGFSVNILRVDQQALSTYFAGGWKEAEPPPFHFVAWEEVPDLRAPRLEGALAALACRTREILEGGDHWIVIGEVVALHQGVEPCLPLIFYSGRYRELGTAHDQPAPQRSDLRLRDEPPAIYYELR